MSASCLKVSAVVCTLNEQGNIGRCLGSLRNQGIDEVVMVDGGSRDRTVDEARSVWSPIRVVVVKGQGLLRQRISGIASSRGDLLLILDADDELIPGSVQAAIRHLEDERLDGTQFGFIPDVRTAWSRRWSRMLEVSSPHGATLPMLGRPALVRRSAFPPDLSADAVPVDRFMEDSYIHREFHDVEPRPRFAAGPGRTLRLQPSSFAEILRKSWRYGLGDAQQVRDFGRLAPTLWHLAIRYPIVRGLRALRGGSPGAALVCVIVGVTRLAGLAFGMRH